MTKRDIHEAYSHQVSAEGDHRLMVYYRDLWIKTRKKSHLKSCLMYQFASYEQSSWCRDLMGIE